MKTTMQDIQRNKGKTTKTLLILGLTLAGLSTLPGRAAVNENPACAKFVGDTTILGSDLDSTPETPDDDHKGVYCNLVRDVFCGIGGKGFVLTTTASRSERKVWIDLKNAEQYNSPPVAAKLLSGGNVEAEINWMGPNDANGNFLPNVVPAPLLMGPGETYLAGLRIRNGLGKYDLRFGQPVAGARSSGCPVIVRAGFDFDANGIIENWEANLDSSEDGSVDIWTIKPSRPDATAILFKGKPTPDGPVTQVIGYFKVPFTLVFTREQFGAVLDLIE